MEMSELRLKTGHWRFSADIATTVAQTSVKAATAGQTQEYAKDVVARSREYGATIFKEN